MPGRRIAVVGVVSVLVLSTGLPARQPQFHGRADLVYVDVSVLDRNREPVRGLTASDFTVTENGRPQPIAAFAEIHLPEPERAAALWMRDVPSDVRRNDDVSERRLIAIVLDDALIPQQIPHMVSSAKAIARRVIEQIGFRDLACVVFTQDGRRAQSFTTDRARLAGAVDSFTGGFHQPLNLLGPPPLDMTEKARGLQSLVVLDELVGLLETVPERRKALVYVTIGAPVSVDDAHPGATPSDPAFELASRFKELLRRAQRASVNIYPIDAGGLDGLRFHLEQELGRTRYEAERNNLRQKIDDLSRTFRDFLQTLADDTGGSAFVNTNEFDRGVNRILRETGSFYLLGYRPPNPRTDGRFRRIEVRANRRGMTVNARRGYFAPEPAPLTPKAPPPETVAAIAGLLPKSDLPLAATAAPVGVSAGGEYPVAVLLALPAPPAGTGSDTVHLLVSAFNVHGDRRAWSELKAEVTLQAAGRAGGGAEAAYEVFARVDLAPGRYELRLSAASGAHGTSGSVYYDVEVPDVGREPLSLSGLMLAADPGLDAGPRNLFADLLPIVPTVRRTFATTDTVTGFLRVYQGGSTPLAPATLTVRIVDGTDRTVFDLPRQIGSDQFSATRSVDYLFDVPVARLEPGPHLLRVDATAGQASARRDLRFTIR